MSQPDLPVQLVIFDCDGVLIDSEIIAAHAQSRALAPYGIALTPRELALRFAGIPDRDQWQTLQQEHGVTLPDHFEADYADSLEAIFRNELRALPHARELTDLLRARGIPYCVASSSERDRLRVNLGIAGLADRFEPHLFSVTQVARGKPWPDLFLHAAATMGVAPGHCLVVEDSVPGVRAARAAGMRVVGDVAAGHIGPGHDARLREAGAFAIVDDLIEVAPLLPAPASAAQPR
ncbi:phosphoglycolate phosphatase [Bordetella genomosp. 1]|uniref:Phosphoglycolate phosphatase n=1 Tax=Bordetella genomosp. 1 TaxID=1395607 RepID=A0A261SJH5_9BORD|nr:HAD family phosphatase [Bordetella genomosp. 1]OZI36493.1 phosphoglycolate phosphatase [Bordetella genomosp. 1]